MKGYMEARAINSDSFTTVDYQIVVYILQVPTAALFFNFSASAFEFLS